MRVGIGYDIHRLVEGRKLIIGGVEIPFEKGLLGHSDADVLVHSICDALLGAMGLGDIGKHFPDTDEKYKGISSMKLLKEVMEKIKKGNFKIVNIDTNIIAEKPRLLPYIEEMKKNLRKILGKDVSVNIKARTNEGLGEIGKGEAIASQAIVLLKSLK
jgi:2-C-methyl-D-erythritol 2,4-cyclodiphosphate synthase